MMVEVNEERLENNKVFNIVEVDYCGPFSVKIGRRQKEDMVLSIHVSDYQSSTH